MFICAATPLQGEEPVYSSALQLTTQAMEAALASAKTRIGQALHALQNTSHLLKLSKLESVYGTASIRGRTKNQRGLKPSWAGRTARHTEI